MDLTAAAKSGDLDKVRDCLSEGHDVNCKNQGGSTALILAAHGGHTDVVRLLLEANADAALTNKSGKTAMACASMRGNPACVQALLEGNAGESAGIPDDDGMTPLMHAVTRARKECIQALINSPQSNSAAVDKQGRTALWLAVENKQYEVLHMLLNTGAGKALVDVPREEDGFTPIFHTAATNDVIAMRLLFEEGNASPLLKDKAGKLARDYAELGQEKNPMADWHEVVQYLEIAEGTASRSATS